MSELDETATLFPLSTHVWPPPHIVGDSEAALLLRALNSDNWSHATLAHEFEQEFASYVGARYAVLTPSGTAALYLSLRAAGLQQGHEVIVPGITWPAVAYAVIKAGGVPRTADISPDSLCMTADTIEQAITPKTFAVLPTHLFGSQCDMPSICDLAASRGIVVIEDAAQSIGSIQAGKHCGTWGLAGAFSLNDRKLLACGEGGCIVTDDGHLHDELLRLQLILPERESRPAHLPGTYKVSEFQAAVALAQLRRLDTVIAAMTANADMLTSLLAEDHCVHPQTAPASVNRQSYFCYCFNVDGVDNITDFRQNLGRHLNLRVSAPYVPLSEVTDLSPSVGLLSSDILSAISVHHRGCDTAYRRRTVRLPHSVLRAQPDLMQTVADTILRTRALAA